MRILASQRWKYSSVPSQVINPDIRECDLLIRLDPSYGTEEPTEAVTCLEELAGVDLKAHVLAKSNPQG